MEFVVIGVVVLVVFIIVLVSHIVINKSYRRSTSVANDKLQTKVTEMLKSQKEYYTPSEPVKSHGFYK